MDLLPMIEKSGEKSMNLFPQAAMKAESEPDKAQMTIFYAGQVVVFNDFPADKAKEIMLMASSTSKGNNTQNPGKQVESAADLVTPAVNRVHSFGNTSIQENQTIVSGNNFPLLSVLPCFSFWLLIGFSSFVFADLPIARRASLTRFLEKRKDRLTAKVPYHKPGAGPKQEENKGWLGLGAQFPVKTEQY